MQTAAEDPANIPARQLVLSEAEGLARRFNTIYDRISEQNDFINKQMVGGHAIRSIAGHLDCRLQRCHRRGGGQWAGSPTTCWMPAKRRSASCPTYIGVTVVPQDDSTLNLFIGSGQPLVVGSHHQPPGSGAGTADPTRFEVQFRQWQFAARASPPC